MDVFYFLTSINKVSLVAFLFTLGVLVYEVILFKKESRQRTKPKVPNFQESASSHLAQAQIINQEKSTKISRPNNLILIISIIFVVLFGFAAFFGFSKINKEIESTTLAPTPVIDFITSKGIKIFDKEFQVISDELLGSLKEGEEIIIGVETIPTDDIDRARIRVNKKEWENEDITLKYSDQLKVYYTEYVVASNESKLQIEAQLHSSTEGWLGD